MRSKKASRRQIKRFLGGIPLLPVSSLLPQALGDTKADLVIKNVEILDVFSGRFRRGDVAVGGGVFVGVFDAYAGQQEINGEGLFLVPGFIDTHVHIESSMMTPACFAAAVLPRGTTTVIWDPHEITNVKGVAGIEWALSMAEGSALDIFVMLPSCVPSTSPGKELETSGAVLSAADLAPFVHHPKVLGLAEMMNFPGVLSGDKDVHEKLSLFAGRSRDGHCPGLTGKALNAYAMCGISTCHESVTFSEAQEKLSKGVHVLIREGSCAKDAGTLLPLLSARTGTTIGLCSDDRNPLDIEEEGHLDAIINMGLRSGQAPEDIFRAASFGAAMIYKMCDRGAVAPGYCADFVLVEQKARGTWNEGFMVREVFKAGKNIKALNLNKNPAKKTEHFSGRNLHLQAPTKESLHIGLSGKGEASVRVIGVRPRQILTDELSERVSVGKHSIFEPDLKRDLLPMAVLERHHGSNRVGKAIVRGFNLQRGAIATSINHDCHNIIVVGASYEAMVAAVHELMEIDGGIAVVDGSGKNLHLPLPIGGLMTDASPEEVSRALKELKALVKKLGCILEEPFLQLSFLALPVIPHLKLTDFGLVKVLKGQVVPLQLS